MLTGIIARWTVVNYHLISRCTANPQKASRTRTMGIAVMVMPNSAELTWSTTINSWKGREHLIPDDTN